MLPGNRVAIGLCAAIVSVWTMTGSAQFYPYPYYVDAGSSLRIEVTPRQAEVYVDGYYAGIVDDFDGVFQRLHLAPGQHDITLYRDGFRSVTQKIYLTPASTFKLRYMMVALGPGDVAEPRPTPPPQPPAQNPPPPPRRGRSQQTPPGTPPPPPPSPEEARPETASGTGTIEIRVQPADADVLVDGQPWRTPDGRDRIVIDVPEGRHTIQIRKSGFVGYLTEVEVHRGETLPVNVTLRTQP